MILTASPGETFLLSPTSSVSLSLKPFHLALPNDVKKRDDLLAFLEQVTFPSHSYALLSLPSGVVQEDEKVLLLYLLKKGVHLVLDGGLIEENATSLSQKGLVRTLLDVEQRTFRPVSVLLSTKRLPWVVVAPFVLELLMTLGEGCSLFIDGAFSSSSILADMAFGISSHRLSPSSCVSCIPLLRPKVVPYKSSFVEIPCLSELERVQSELEHSPRCGLAFFQNEAARSLLRYPLYSLFMQAKESKMSLRSFLRRALHQEMNLSLSSIYEIEEDLRELERIFLALPEKLPEESSYASILDAIFTHSLSK